MENKTLDEEFLIREQNSSGWNKNTPRTNLWFRVLHGEDKGIEVRIPLTHPDYSKHMRSTLSNLSEGDIVQSVLERDLDGWRPVKLEKVGSL